MHEAAPSGMLATTLAIFWVVRVLGIARTVCGTWVNRDSSDTRMLLQVFADQLILATGVKDLSLMPLSSE